VTRLDADARAGRRAVVPAADLSTKAWARSIRQGGLSVDMAGGISLPIESRWPGGHVVTVSDALGHAYYFAVPCDDLTKGRMVVCDIFSKSRVEGTWHNQRPYRERPPLTKRSAVCAD
jgi:hypothetical protein